MEINMQSPLQITFRGIEPSEAIERRIRARAAELERFSDDITGCHVTVDLPHRRHQQGNLYRTRIDIRLPDEAIVVGQERRHDHAHEDVNVAIRDAFDAAVRRLEDYARKRRGQVKRHEAPTHGRVARLFPDEEYGFVTMPDGTDVYFHAHSVPGGGFDALEVGDEVRCVIAEGEGEKGPQASAVVPIGKHHIVDEPGA
jgi:cold shock CspA family protein